MNESTGLGKIGGIIVAVGLLLMLSSCSVKAMANFLIFGIIVAGIGALLLVLFVIGLALKGTQEEAKANGTTTGTVTGTSTSERIAAGTGTSTSARLAAKTANRPELKAARQTVSEERLLLGRINDKETREAATKVLDQAEKVLDTLATKPEKISTSHQFLNYYLPTLGVILKKFKTLEESGVETGDTKEKVVKYMADIQTALEKQYQNLYDADILDLAVEMEAMTIGCKRDGLLAEEDITMEDGEQVIKLTM